MFLPLCNIDIAFLTSQLGIEHTLTLTTSVSSDGTPSQLCVVITPVLCDKEGCLKLTISSRYALVDKTGLDLCVLEKLPRHGSAATLQAKEKEVIDNRRTTYQYSIADISSVSLPENIPSVQSSSIVSLQPQALYIQDVQVVSCRPTRIEPLIVGNDVL